MTRPILIETTAKDAVEKHGVGVGSRFFFDNPHARGILTIIELMPEPRYLDYTFLAEHPTSGEWSIFDSHKITIIGETNALSTIS